MIKTIAYTNARPHTVPRGVQCQIAGSLYSAHCSTWAQSPWRSTSQRLLPAVVTGTSLSGTSTLTGAWPPSDAHRTAASGLRSRLLSTQATPSRGSVTSLVTARSPGTATQTPSNNTSAISSTQSAEGPPSEIRGSSPGSRISCTLSSVGRALLESSDKSRGRGVQVPQGAFSSADSSGPSGRGRAPTSVGGRVVRTPLRAFSRTGSSTSRTTAPKHQAARVSLVWKEREMCGAVPIPSIWSRSPIGKESMPTRIASRRGTTSDQRLREETVRGDISDASLVRKLSGSPRVSYAGSSPAGSVGHQTKWKQVKAPRLAASA